MHRIIFLIFFLSKLFAEPLYLRPFFEVEEKTIDFAPIALAPIKDKKQEEIILKNSKSLEAKILQDLFGQDHAVKESVNAIKRYAAGILQPNQPVGKMLFYGPSGVGKTELVKLLALHLYQDPAALIRIDMSEYSEPHSLAKLIGSPPGYVGYGEDTILSTPLVKNPYRIVLLDEIEKAHISVLRLFLQVFDNGCLTTSSRKTVDCTKALFVMTSNLGALEITRLHNKGTPSFEIEYLMRPYLMEALTPELFNRMDPILFHPLSDKHTELLVKKALKQLQTRVWDAKQITLIFDPSLIEFFVMHGVDPILGARPLQRMIDKRLATAIAETLLNSSLKKNDILRCSYIEDNIVIEKA